MISVTFELIHESIKLPTPIYTNPNLDILRGQRVEQQSKIFVIEF